MALGIYVVRWRRQRAKLPEPQFKAWHVVILFNILIHALPPCHALVSPPMLASMMEMSVFGMQHTL